MYCKLPQPLSKEDELKYYQLLDEGCTTARTVLIERNLRLVIHVAKKFSNTQIEFEELVSIGNFGLMKAVKTFKPSKGIKLATYATRCISNEILMALRRNRYQMNTVSLEEPLNIDYEGNELRLEDLLGTDADEVSKHLEKEADIDTLRLALARLSPRENQIITMRFGLNNTTALSQREISAALGISQSYVSRLEKQVYTQLKKLFERMGGNVCHTKQRNPVQDMVAVN